MSYERPDPNQQLPLVARWAQALMNRLRQIDGNMAMQLADKLGVKKFSLRNSDDAEVMSVDSLGDLNVASRIKFKSAVADGGTYGVFGVDGGVVKNLELYDYFNNRPFIRMYGARADVEMFSTVNYPRVQLTRITTFLNSWVNAADHNGANQAGYYQDATGKVFVVGAISSGTAGAASFTLPAGLRPSAQEMFACASTAAGLVRVDVNSGGDVIVQVAGAGTVYLGPISFYPAEFDSLFTAVTYTNSWVDFAAGWTGVQYYKDSWGRVHLRGLMKSGSVGLSAFTLPAGSRPTYQTARIAIANGAAGRVDAYAAGTVIVQIGSNVYVGLSGNMLITAPVSAFLMPAQLGAWVDFDATNWAPISYWRDPSGRVHVVGLAKSGTIGAGATGQTHSIPLAWCPPLNNTWAVVSNDAYGRALISSQGAYMSAEVGSNVWYSYGGVHWMPAET